jgi:hypothetical protein
MNRIHAFCVAAALAVAFVAVGLGAEQQSRPSTPPALTRQRAEQALSQAVRFFHLKVARDGGYLWQYSGDLSLREAEGKVSGRRVWVQPPGTPTIGEAFLDAYEATGRQEHLQAARDAAEVLLRGQMITGGWGYHVECDPENRKEYGYRDLSIAGTRRWNRATVLDDDTTQAAVRFLARLDKLLEFKEKALHEAVAYALDRILISQYPNGAWFGWWEWPPKPHDPKQYPVKPASYPDDWPRKPGDSPVRYPARYILNDNVVPDVIRTLLEAWEIYREKRYLSAASKAGNFLLLAQMPDPQPGWAQQYDADMHPCWGRKFEPPAITGEESQGVLEALLMLYRRTGEKKFLQPLPRALAYFKKSLLPDGRLARFYELKTNRPLYFTRDYRLTYNADEVPTHYSFIRESRLAAIEDEYRRLLKLPPEELNRTRPPDAQELGRKVRGIIDGMDQRGAWVEKGQLRFHKVQPASGVVNCRTFADNVRTLCQFIRTAR